MRSHTLCCALAAALSACSDDDDEPSDATLDERAARLQADLEDLGFEVVRGGSRLFSIDDCPYAIDAFGSCFGNNPTAPYVLLGAPLWPDEFADPTVDGAFGPMPGESWATHRLDPREALVVLADMPPEAAYFGLQSYVFSREGELDPTDPLYQSIDDPVMHDILFTESADPSRVLVFSSVGDSINDVVIEERGGDPWEQQRFFVSATDARIDREVNAAMTSAGVPQDHIFTEPLSGETMRLGLDASADDVMTLIRYSEPVDEAAGDAWREDLPMVVLRVRDPGDARAAEPYPAAVYEQIAGVSELALADDVDALIAAVKDRWNQPDATAGQFFSLRTAFDLVGQHCLERPMNCLGDTQDADYQASPTVTLDDGEVLAIVGTLATETGNATYVSLSVNRIEVLMGVANISGRDLEGTAGPFQQSVQNTHQMYVQYVSRDCTGLQRCLEITEEMVPPGETIKVIQRNYVVPGTRRGADPDLLVSPSLIVLDGAERPPAP